MMQNNWSWSLEGKSCTFTYEGKTLKGICENSRVKYGSSTRVQHMIRSKSHIKMRDGTLTDCFIVSSDAVRVVE